MNKYWYRLPVVALASVLLNVTLSGSFAGSFAHAEALSLVEHERSSEIRAEIRSLRRKNNIITLKGKVSNGSDRALSFRFIEESYLLDEEKGIKYFPIRDKKGNYIATSKFYPADRNSTRKFFIKFPAPPPEIGSIGVYIQGFDPADDIAISDD